MLTCIRLALTVVIAEGLGLSVAFALGPAYSTSVGAPARTSGQVVAAVRAAAQGLKSDGDAQGISTRRGVRVTRVLPLWYLIQWIEASLHLVRTRLRTWIPLCWG